MPLAWIIVFVVGVILMAPMSALCDPQAPSLRRPFLVDEPEKGPWWKSAVFYEIYPRSFADSNNDGIGDLNGITSKLDYLKSLGIDAIWLTPCYPSPQVDFGYDISDYCNIAPEYGTLKDFDRLVQEARKRKMRIVMDLVMNHTSDRNKWFEQSRSSRKNPKRDWYIWKDPGPDGKPPNNWLSVFGHSAWTLDKKTGQYYYHFFYPQQPDLNWRNPQVKKAMFDVARFWLDRGVAGFRLDAVMALYEDPKLTPNPIKPGKNRYGDPNMENKYNDRLPEVHTVMRELRKVIDSYPDNRVLIGETSANNTRELWDMYGVHLDEIQLPMNFFFAYINKLSADEFRKQIQIWDGNPYGGWPVYLFSNHDQPRHYVRYAVPGHEDEIAKLTAALLLTLRGTPILYYGEELGMANNDPKRKEDVLDPIGKIGWPQEKGRDGERTPMQWDATANAGFSRAKPWLPVGPDYRKKNVAAELKDPDSVLNFYRSLIRLRKRYPVLTSGEYNPIDQENPNVLAYSRFGFPHSFVVALNMTAKPQRVKLGMPARTRGYHSVKTVLSTSPMPPTAEEGDVTLAPYGVYIGESEL